MKPSLRLVRFSMVAVLAAAALGCPGRRVEILAERDAAPPPPEPIRTCAGAFARGRPGDPCAIPEGRCLRERGCCTDEAVCESGVLLLFEGMCAGCGECAVDDECEPGFWCISNGCLPCPPTPTCPGCPPGLVTFVRNGCDTCECVPERWCGADGTCPDAAGASCLPGALCLPCGDGVCCSSACARSDCPLREPAPEGCARPCGDPSICPGTGLCRNHHCFCDAAGWHCEQECVDEPLLLC